MAATSTTGTYTPKPGEDEKFTKLKSTLYREEQNARAWQDGEMTEHRSKSFKYYNREPMGDEEPGQSQVVTSEYQDTIESIMPALLRVFTSGDEVVHFSADTQEDAQFEDEATDYVSHLLMRKNEGFIFWTWFLKDCLMYRLAWAVVDVEEKEEVKSKPFGPLPPDAFALMKQQAEQMAEQSGAELTIEAERDPPSGSPDEPLDSRLMPIPTFSGKITTTRKVKVVAVDNIAPEDGMVSPMARHIDAASMCGYRKRVTASELRIMGLSEEDIREIATDELYTVEQAERQPDVIQATSERDQDDDSERQFWIAVQFVRFDWDEDGTSELLRVVYAHAGGEPSKVIELEEWTDGIAPVIPGSPILMSHTIPGKSIFDLVKDIQEISTAVTRGMLNNMYLVNHPRPAVSDKVDLQSLIDWTPGMPIRMRQAAKPTPEELNWVTPTPIMDKALMVLRHKDEILQKRTGIEANNAGILDDNSNPTAAGANLAVAAASERIELIARTIAETAGKRLYRLIYQAVKRIASGPITYRSDDDFKTIDPTKWPDDMGMEVNVGFGASNKQQQLQHLGLVAQGQEKLWAAQGNQPGPLLKLNHLANTFRRMVRTMGIKTTDEYVASDQEIAASPPPQPPPTDPKIALEQQKLQVQQQESANQDQIDRQRLAFDQEKERNAIIARQEEAQFKNRQIDLEELKLHVDEKKHATQLTHEAMEADKSRAHEREKSAADRQHDMAKAMHAAEVKERTQKKADAE